MTSSGVADAPDLFDGAVCTDAEVDRQLKMIGEQVVDVTRRRSDGTSAS